MLVFQRFRAGGENSYIKIINLVFTFETGAKKARYRVFNGDFIVRYLILMATVIMATVSSQSANAQSSDYTKFLNEYYKIVFGYESYANKEKLRQMDLLKLNTKVSLKLIKVAKASPALANFTPEDLNRYMTTIKRYTNALTKLGPKMGNVSC